MTDVCSTVKFSYKGQRWHHDFVMPRGSTVLQLKEKMVKSGSKEEVNQVELQQRGRRVPDFEVLSRDEVFDFFLLWPEEGAKRARIDEANRNRPRAEPERPRAQQEPPQRQPEQPKPQPAEAAAAPKPAFSPFAAAPAGPQEVQVTVTHAVDGSQITVKVMSDATIMDVRRAVMAAVDEVKLSEVKLVKKMGSSFTSLTGDDKLGEKREFLSMGRSFPGAAKAAAAAAPAPAPAPAAPQPELTFTVTIDQDMGFTTTAALRRLSTVQQLKQALADQDPTGSTQVGSFQLCIRGKSPLPDSIQLTEEHLELDITL